MAEKQRLFAKGYKNYYDDARYASKNVKLSSNFFLQWRHAMLVQEIKLLYF